MIQTLIPTARVLKPNRSKPQWPPEMASYTIPGVVVGKLMMWSERSQIKLRSWQVELHWRLSTGPHWAHTMLPFPVHLTSMLYTSLTCGLWLSLMQLLHHFIRWSVLGFHLLNTQPGQSQPLRMIPPSPFEGSEFSQHHTIFTWNSFVQISIKPFWFLARFFFFFPLSKYLQVKYSVESISVK